MCVLCVYICVCCVCIFVLCCGDTESGQPLSPIFRMMILLCNRTRRGRRHIISLRIKSTSLIPARTKRSGFLLLNKERRTRNTHFRNLKETWEFEFRINKKEGGVRSWTKIQDLRSRMWMVSSLWGTPRPRCVPSAQSFKTDTIFLRRHLIWTTSFSYFFRMMILLLREV